MPSSTPQGLTTMVRMIQEAHPASILDVGVGYGKWGFLCREYLEAYEGRVYPESWSAKLIGIEIFEPYVRGFGWTRSIYNEIYVGDALDVARKLVAFDLVIAGDVIEHLEKQRAADLIELLKSKALKMLLVSIPLGVCWLDNRVVAGNQYEKHRSSWSATELSTRHGLDLVERVDERGREVGIFVLRK